MLWALFSIPALAISNADWREVCDGSLGICAAVNISTDAIYLPADYYNGHIETIEEFREVGVTFGIYGDALKEVFTLHKIKTEYSDYRDDGTHISTMSPEAKSLLVDSASCTVGILGCTGLALGGHFTGGLSYFLMKAECAATGIFCYAALDSYQAWKAASRARDKSRKENAKKKEEAAKGKVTDEPKLSANPGSTGEIPAGVTVITPYTKLKEGVVTVIEAKPQPSSGGGLEKKPKLPEKPR